MKTKDSYRIVFYYTERELKSGDVSYVAPVFKNIVRSGGEDLAAMLGRVEFSFYPFDSGDDIPPAYALPEYRAYVRKILDVFPWWFYFLSLRGKTLQFFAFSTLESIETVVRRDRPGVDVAWNVGEMRDFFRDQALFMKDLFQGAGLSKKLYRARLRQLGRYFKISDEHWNFILSKEIL